MKSRKIIIILNITLLFLIIACFIYVYKTGDRYTLHTNIFINSDTLREYDVTFEKEGILKLESAQLDNEELTFTFTALKKGATKVNLNFSYGEENYKNAINDLELRVNSLGLISEKSSYSYGFSGYLAVIITFLIALLLIIIMMIIRFYDHYKEGSFSYPMIACGGIGLYAFIILLFIIYKLLNNAIYIFSVFVTLLNETVTIALVFLTPSMLILSILLAISNIWLMKHEGYRPVNALGIIFAVLWFVGSLLVLNAFAFKSELANTIYIYTRMICMYIIAYLECLFLSTTVSTFLASKYKIKHNQDYIIILGCAIRKDGSLTPLLKNRVDSAVEFEKKQFEEIGKHAVFVPSGGQGSDEIISEGEAMENYLVSIGVPAERILREDKSINTFQNMQYSKAIIEKDTEDISKVNIAFSTTNYHVFRSYILAKKNGFKAMGISAKTKPYFFPNAFLREFIGLLADQKWKNLAYLILLIFAGILISLH